MVDPNFNLHVLPLNILLVLYSTFEDGVAHFTTAAIYVYCLFLRSVFYYFVICGKYFVK
jgi:hypothetical protein